MRFLLLFIVAALSGCMGTGHDHGDHGADTTYHVGSFGDFRIMWNVTTTEAPAGVPFLLGWKIGGTGELPHTGLHWGPMGHADGVDVHDYPNVSGAIDEPFALPFAPTVEVTVEEPGTYYFRAHAKLSDLEHITTNELTVVVS